MYFREQVQDELREIFEAQYELCLLYTSCTKMAYVPVPKDLSKIKTKLAFNLTKRQLVCFSSAAAVGWIEIIHARRATLILAVAPLAGCVD